MKFIEKVRKKPPNFEFSWLIISVTQVYFLFLSLDQKSLKISKHPGSCLEKYFEPT